MNKGNLVSVIIPVYNAEKYVARCLNSLINQSYKNIEIVIVDDGYKDNSYSDIKKIKDDRIKLFSRENLGVSNARNFGLSKAKGDFITFVDIDDYVDDFMIENLVCKADKEKKSLVIGNNLELYKEQSEERKLFDGNTREIEKKDAMRNIASGIGGLVANKLFSRKIIDENNIYFNKKIKVSEDQLFFLEIAEKSENIVYLNKSLYFYDRKNEDSASQKYQNNMLENFLELQRITESIFERNRMNSYEDKVILNNKIFNWFLLCLLNEIRDKGILKSKKQLEYLILEAKTLEKEFIKPNNFVYKLILFNIKDKFLSKISLLCLGKVLVLKNG